MYYWRVTKYNPKYRKGNTYLHEEWTSITDIGNYFNGTEFTAKEYFECEGQYINAVVLTMRAADIVELEIGEMEKNGYRRHQDLAEPFTEIFYNSLHNGMSVNINDIGLLMKLILREMVWGKLSNKDFFVHFGYDYYMYLGIPNIESEVKETIIKSGLFVDNTESPYLK